MDDDAVGSVQAHLLCQAVQRAGLELGRWWWEYFCLGGEVGRAEADAYLHGCLRLPPLERDLLAHAVNGLLHHAPVPPAPYSWHVLGPQDDAAPRGRRGDPGRGPRS
jgi:hypothetical protein